MAFGLRAADTGFGAGTKIAAVALNFGTGDATAQRVSDSLVDSFPPAVTEAFSDAGSRLTFGAINRAETPARRCSLVCLIAS